MENYIIAIPHYVNEHTISLKVIDFNQRRQLITVKINGVAREIHLSSDYESFNMTFPELGFERQEFTKNSKIPKVIMQNYEKRNVTRKKYLSIRSIIDHNPNFKYVFFDSEARS